MADARGHVELDIGASLKINGLKIYVSYDRWGYCGENHHSKSIGELDQGGITAAVRWCGWQLNSNKVLANEKKNPEIEIDVDGFRMLDERWKIFFETFTMPPDESIACDIEPILDKSGKVIGVNVEPV